MSTEKYLLDAPVLPQSQNGILDKSKISGEIKVNVPKYLGYSKYDKIHLWFGSEQISKTHILNNPENPEDLESFLSFYFNIDEIPEGNYAVTYSIINVFNEGRKSNSTNVQVVDSISSVSFSAPTIKGLDDEKTLDLSKIVMRIPAYPDIKIGDRITGYIDNSVSILTIDKISDYYDLSFSINNLQDGYKTAKYDVNGLLSQSMSFKFIK
ncbi:hypothetical protein [Xenorhabdus sp. PB62.4]|uniref:hypothetical protein n=1 Tax=Xenorhabdus sp. PB62.4 TaxID=1851573 RepID=UPI001657261D|nr:hypothetical protein [Xenorhabdus sp. PB62.4]MBC8954326.1 hypothetical protein [Xenorhabdus sp. PB62.4]